MELWEALSLFVGGGIINRRMPWDLRVVLWLDMPIPSLNYFSHLLCVFDPKCFRWDVKFSRKLHKNTHFLSGQKVELKQAARQTSSSQRPEVAPGSPGLWKRTNWAQPLTADVSSNRISTGLEGQEARFIRLRAKTLSTYCNPCASAEGKKEEEGVTSSPNFTTTAFDIHARANHLSHYLQRHCSNLRFPSKTTKIFVVFLYLL